MRQYYLREKKTSNTISEIIWNIVTTVFQRSTKTLEISWVSWENGVRWHENLVFLSNSHSLFQYGTIKDEKDCYKTIANTQILKSLFVSFFNFQKLFTLCRYWDINKLEKKCHTLWFVKCWSSPSDVFLRKGVLKICSKFAWEHPWQNAISIKLLYWNHTLAWVFSCTFAACFWYTFSKEHLWMAASALTIPKAASIGIIFQKNATLQNFGIWFGK